MSSSSMPTPHLQTSGMLSKEQLLHLFNHFSFLASQPGIVLFHFADVGMSIYLLHFFSFFLKVKLDCMQEAIAVTTEIQEEIFQEMGIDPSFGLACLGKVNLTYENDQDLMIQFYKFVATEEMVCDEAEHGPDEFAERMDSQQKLQEQQLEMLNYMRRFHLDDQFAILEKLHHQMEDANFESAASVLSSEQIQEIVRRRVSPVFRSR
ncbi:hypothetical protein WN944_010342 [Citrus x changshan-huyou]|uniref:Uncharacterized protein n=1 Tax=Citrus x changshan-huyou TaxID=2935761 RepID=A0AAP0MRH7_9ROSI